MAVNAEVQKSGSENALSTIRKFSRRVQGTGLVRSVRARRYFARDTSKIVKKKRALKLIEKRSTYRRLVKEGKIAEAPVRGGNRSLSMRSETSAPTSSPSRFGETTPIAR